MTTAAPPSERHYVRFGRADRLLHAGLMTSFLGLAATGLPLLFSDMPWAARLVRVFGGFVIAGRLHRVFAIVMIAVFLIHVGRIGYRIFARGEYGLLWGPGSMVPQPRDVVELYRHTRWFLGLGPRPEFDRYTYWEKFDYWAVFWGMLVIGGSGLILWFPATFAMVLPGWMFNVALVVHGEEALLAVGFIFTVHFFNGHLRPGKFPMDLVIFTGVVSEAEMRNERSLELARLEAEGALSARAAPAPTPQQIRTGYAVGGLAIAIGLTLVGLIVYSLIGGGH
jgi:cytochrome b subunit of formate dehydrogenase